MPGDLFADPFRPASGEFVDVDTVSLDGLSDFNADLRPAESIVQAESASGADHSNRNQRDPGAYRQPGSASLRGQRPPVRDPGCFRKDPDHLVSFQSC